MRMRYRILALVAACSLTFNGCGQVAPTPPPDATTDTPMLDIDQGTEVPPDEIGKKTDGRRPTPVPQTRRAMPARQPAVNSVKTPSRRFRAVPACARG